MSLTILSLTVLALLQCVSSFKSVQSTASIGYYAGWHATKGFPLDKISWGRYTTVIYAFAVPTSANNISLDGSDPSQLPNFVCEAHKHHVDAHIAIGGWGGSKYFSSNIATPENRTAFVKAITDFTQQYQLDGINLDWEYPNKQGIGCNTISANDTQNLLAFLQELREDPVGLNLTVSAAVSITPFHDASGNPLKNVSEFAAVLDYINIMNYDIWGSWSSAVGPNAPLDDRCASPANQDGSAVSAVEAWTAAGMPPNKIVLGVAAYGHSFSVTPQDAFVNGSQNELAAYPKFNPSNQPSGDRWDNTGSIDVCGVYEAPGGTYRLWGLMKSGFLDTNGNPARGIYYRYDSCSQTPYVYNATSEIMISYDNVDSFAAKGSYITKASLKGFAMWEAGGDHRNILLDAIRTAVGLPKPHSDKRFERHVRKSHW